MSVVQYWMSKFFKKKKKNFFCLSFFSVLELSQTLKLYWWDLAQRNFSKYLFFQDQLKNLCWSWQGKTVLVQCWSVCFSESAQITWWTRTCTENFIGWEKGLKSGPIASQFYGLIQGYQVRLSCQSPLLYSKDAWGPFALHWGHHFSFLQPVLAYCSLSWDLNFPPKLTNC